MRARTLHRAQCRATGAEYSRDPGSARPFKRIGALVRAVNACAMGTADWIAAAAKLQAYRSRGHAKGGHVRHQLNFEDRSKFVPGACFAQGCR